jgi:putative glutamine amidotransferase
MSYPRRTSTSSSSTSSRSGATLVPVSGHAGASHALHTNGPTPLPVGPRDVVSSFHRFAVAPGGLAAADLIAAAWAPDGSVEALVHRHLPQWGIMWHPERGPADERDRVVFERLFGSARCG